jgi:hypothetical protein
LSVDLRKTNQFKQVLVFLTNHPYAPELRTLTGSKSLSRRFCLISLNQSGGVDLEGWPESWLRRTQS